MRAIFTRNVPFAIFGLQLPDFSKNSPDVILGVPDSISILAATSDTSTAFTWSRVCLGTCMHISGILLVWNFPKKEAVAIFFWFHYLLVSIEGIFQRTTTRRKHKWVPFQKLHNRK